MRTLEGGRKGGSTVGGTHQRRRKYPESKVPKGWEKGLHSQAEVLIESRAAHCLFGAQDKNSGQM